MGKFLVPLVVTMIWSTVTFAADGSAGAGHFDYRAKSESKKTSRWTLEDWLAQKERNQMMDLWLAMYAPSPYEFFLSGSLLSYTTSTSPATTESNVSSIRGSVGAYATVLGLQGYLENNTTEKFSDSGLSLNLRIVGNAVQGTHLIIFYGLRSLHSDSNGVSSNFNQQFAGADLNLYFNHYVGISGRYQYDFPVDSGSATTSSGFRSEAALFLDFSAVRVFGGGFKDFTRLQTGGLEADTIRTGYQGGLQFFF